MPFGGFKKSGVGREGVRHAVREMTEPKNTIINIAGAPMQRQRPAATPEWSASS
jgi:glyceraldehyde-3-phosphate dehydrogenase (NADP+)